MKNLKNKILILILIILLGLGFTAFFYFWNQRSKLTSEERSWLTTNENNIQNIRILNDTNIFGDLGEGIYYTYLEDLQKEYNIKLNNIMISREEATTELQLNVGNALPENALSFYEDHYVLISPTEENIISFEDVTNKKIGVFGSQSEYIKKHLEKQNNIYISYTEFSEMKSALNSGAVSHIIIPRIENMDVILSENYWISYHFSDLKRIYYMHDSKNSILFQIMKKYYSKWEKEEKLQNNLYLEERNLFIESLKIPNTELDSIQKTTLKYGYQNHLPYEIYGDGSFGGIFAQYLSTFANFIGTDIEYTRYNNISKLQKAITNNEITLYLNYNNTLTNGENIITNVPLTVSFYTHESNPVVIHAISSLKDKTIFVEKDTVLKEALSQIEGLKLETYDEKDLEKVLKKKDIILAIDTKTGNFLEKLDLKNYREIYWYNLGKTYNLKSFGNETLNKIITKYFNYLDNNTFINVGFYNAIQANSKDSMTNSIAKYTLGAISIAGIVLIMIYRSKKQVKMQTKLKKEDRLKYIDQLTSLKNRNYLNENLSNWNKNTIYPQSIIMIDLNKIQEINDTLGYEEGDRQIRGAANSLIKTQLDNTDIIRTNGNEFVIYLVGYSQKQITSYIHKLTKELKNLPFEHGVCITYSMIDNDLKSIEDAINECVEGIKKQKEELQKEEEK